MTANISSKAVALAGISVLIAALIAIVNTISQGNLWEIKNAIAALEAAKAANSAAAAQTLDAINKLKGTENAAGAVIAAAQLESTATKVAAQQNATAIIAAAQETARGVIRATEELVRPENAMFDSFTSPLFAEPTKKMAALNEKIVTLKREGETGIDRKTRRVLSDSERADRIAQQRISEEELATVRESTSKNMSDTFATLFNGMTQSMGGLGSLYPTGNEPRAVRRILEEK